LRYVPPEDFDRLRRAGIDMGFRHVEAGPLVRSSYHASEAL
jgi:lipoic acid synthetase